MHLNFFRPFHPPATWNSIKIFFRSFFFLGGGVYWLYSHIIWDQNLHAIFLFTNDHTNTLMWKLNWFQMQYFSYGLPRPFSQFLFHLWIFVRVLTRIFSPIILIYFILSLFFLQGKIFTDFKKEKEYQGYIICKILWKGGGDGRWK